MAASLQQKAIAAVILIIVKQKFLFKFTILLIFYGIPAIVGVFTNN
jgi:hypothetical protein